MAAVAEALGQEATPERLQAVALLVDDLPTGRVLKAVRNLAKTSEWMPKPVHIRNEVTRIAREQRMSVVMLDEPEPTAEEKAAFREHVIKSRRMDGTVDFVKLGKALKPEDGGE